MEFAGIDVKPNNSVNNVRTSPMQAIKPRISRTGLIGRLSATIGFGIQGLLLTQTCRRAQAFNSRNDGFPMAHRSLGEGGSRQVSFDGCPSRRCLVRRCSLTSSLCARKLGHEYQKHDLVSIAWSWHVGFDGSDGNFKSTGRWETCAGFQFNYWRRLAGEPERLSRQMGGAL